MAPETKEGFGLSDEELARALAMRPKVPLTAEQQDGLLEMLEWFEDKRAAWEAKRIRREAWQKRFPVIFGAITTLVATSTAVYNIWVKK